MLGKPWLSKPEEQKIDDGTYSSTIGIINGKCLWCGADASEFPDFHFEEHEKEDEPMIW